MDVRTILLTPRFDPNAATLSPDALPNGLRLEAEASGPGHLDVEMTYRRRPAGGPMVRMARWDLTHDARNGRILRLTFPETRSDPKMPYDEIVGALATINLAYASPEDDPESYRFGLAMSSRLLLVWFYEDEEPLRAALTPPFPDPPQ